MPQKTTKVRPLELYSVTFHRYDSEEMDGQVKAMAKRKQDKAVIEDELTYLQIKKLLWSIYGNQNSIDASLNQLEADGLIEIRSDPSKPIFFTSAELITFGFDHEKLEALST